MWMTQVLLAMLIASKLNTCCLSWTIDANMSFQFQGGSQNGNYVSLDDVGTATALSAGTSADKWTIAPVRIDGVHEWGVIITGVGGDGLTYKWSNFANNHKQVRAYILDQGVYFDSDKFILIPKNWGDQIFQMKNHETGEYVYINSNNRLKAGGSESQASGMSFVSQPCLVFLIMLFLKAKLQLVCFLFLVFFGFNVLCFS